MLRNRAGQKTSSRLWPVWKTDRSNKLRNCNCKVNKFLQQITTVLFLQQRATPGTERSFEGHMWTNRNNWYIQQPELLCNFIVHTQFRNVAAVHIILAGRLHAARGPRPAICRPVIYRNKNSFITILDQLDMYCTQYFCIRITRGNDHEKQ
jgi:hypothetical protein